MAQTLGQIMREYLERTTKKRSHASDWKNSDVSINLAILMADNKPRTTLEIFKHLVFTDCVYPINGISNEISKLRHNGFEFASAKLIGTKNGKRIYQHQMTGGNHKLLEL